MCSIPAPCLSCVLLCCIICPTSIFGADEEPEAPDDASAQRLKIMRGTIDGFQIKSPAADSEAPPTFLERPRLRYNDQTRDAGQGRVLDATMWRLGEKGRPIALLTLEIYRAEKGSPFLTYELVSLTPHKFEMRNSRGDVNWLPHSTQLAMEVLNVDTVPADTPRARVAQMRELARRFSAEEKLRGEKISLRLLAQPVDRYDDKMAGIVDGAVFVFANGTNPELGLLLECSDKQWSFGTFRLASAELFAECDGKSVAIAPKPAGWPVDAPYTATRHTIFLPDEVR